MNRLLRTALLVITIVVSAAVSGFVAGRSTAPVTPIDQESLREIRDEEYIRVINAVADAYGYDPSEVESDAKLVDGEGNIKR